MQVWSEVLARIFVNSAWLFRESARQQFFREIFYRKLREEREEFPVLISFAKNVVFNTLLISIKSSDILLRPCKRILEEKPDFWR